MTDEVVLYVSHEAQGKLGGEDARVLGLVLLQDVGLDGATNAVERFGFQRRVGLGVKHFVAGASQQHQAEAIIAFGKFTVVGGAGESAVVPFGLQDVFHLVLEALFADVRFTSLIDGRIQEESQHDGSGTIDGHGDACGGGTEVEAAVQFFGVIQAANAHA